MLSKIIISWFITYGGDEKGPVVAGVIPITTRITESKLNDSNFFEWSKIIRVYLRNIGKASHLTSDPPTNDSSKQWF